MSLFPVQLYNSYRTTRLTCGFGIQKALKPRSFKAFHMAGAEGLEPSARGFGVDVDRCKQA